MSIKKQVETLLTNHPKFRDDRNGLLAEVLSTNKKLNFIEIAAISANFKDAANIDRYFRQVQQENVELRGQKYLDRQEKAKDKQKELGYNVK